MLKYFQFL